MKAANPRFTGSSHAGYNEGRSMHHSLMEGQFRSCLGVGRDCTRLLADEGSVRSMQESRARGNR